MKKILLWEYYANFPPITLKLLRVMKLSILLTCILSLNLMASVYSQNTMFNLDIKDQSVRDVLKTIENESLFRFFYNDEFTDLDKKLTLVTFNQPIDSLLSLILDNTEVSYKVLDNNFIVITPKLLLQQVKVTGIVTDATNGQPLAGVNVVVEGTIIGATTDANGKYLIDISQDNAILVFSFIGYKTEKITVGNQTTIDMKISPDVTQLSDVVVVGFGTQKKVNLTGSVGSVSGEDMTLSIPTNVVIALQGRIPGVSISQTTGQPGSEDVSILIRGIGTMNYAGPMIIVDGLESSMSNISPDDIESVSVLKDASSAAIYGSRAANGVILVTTKRGKAGTSVITYKNSFGWQKPTSLPEHLSSWEYAELYNEGNKNQGIPARYSDADILKYKSGSDPYNFPNTDWLDLLLTESGYTQDHNLALSGGNEITRYRASFEYFNQEGLIKHSNHKRYNARINIDSHVKNWLTIGLNTSLSKNIVTYPISPFSGGEEFFRQTNFIPPTVTNKNEDGTWNRHTDGNPIAWVAAGGLRNGDNSDLLSSVFGEINLLKGLTLKSVMGINYNFGDTKRHVKTIDYYSSGVHTIQGPNSVNDQNSRQQTITLQSFLNFDRKFAKHGIKALLGISRESSQYSINEAYRQNFASNELDQLNAGSTAGMTNGGYILESRLGSYFGRINYDYNTKYLFEANLRRDASSKFARGYRVGWFPSVSAGWRVSEETFMKNVNFVDNMKLRVSWGQLGNNNIGDYNYFQRIKLGQNYNFGGMVADGASTTIASNPFISWEKTTELDLGIDIDLFHNKLLSLSADYYNRYTDDILTTIPVSMVFGLPGPTVNAGAMRNKGFELVLEHNKVFKDFQYGVSINASYNDNKVEKFAFPSKGSRIYAEGISWGSFYGYEAIGIYQTDAEALASAHVEGAPVEAGDLIFKDQKTTDGEPDGIINGDDRIVLGNAIPKITYGFNIDMKYKELDFSCFFQGAGQVYRVIGGETFWAFDPNNALKMHLDRTIVENGVVVKKGYYPRILTTEKHNQDLSSFSVLNASYLRMKNIQLGYTLPAHMLTVVNISRARVYASGQNLLTFTKFPSSFDPELPDGGANWSYPQVQFYTFGVDVTF